MERQGENADKSGEGRDRAVESWREGRAWEGEGELGSVLWGAESQQSPGQLSGAALRKQPRRETTCSGQVAWLVKAPPGCCWPQASGGQEGHTCWAFVWFVWCQEGQADLKLHS